MTDAGERIEREQNFHNARFTEETRDAQAKYYATVAHALTAYNARVETLGAGADVLEYGCAKGARSVDLAKRAKSVVGIDISDVGIEQARQTAKRAALSNCTFEVMNAEALSLPDQGFDLIFGSGILHHLDLSRSFGELARVLRPDGAAVMWEPLGHNALINWYRQRTPAARTADEHPLLRSDMKIAGRFFDDVRLRFFGLTTLGMTPFRNGPLFAPGYFLTQQVDRMLLSLPWLRWQAWFVLLELRNPRRGA